MTILRNEELKTTITFLNSPYENQPVTRIWVGRRLKSFWLFGISGDTTEGRDREIAALVGPTAGFPGWTQLR